MCRLPPAHALKLMRILVLSPYFPWPLFGGNLIRIFGVLKELALRGHDIVLLAGHAGPEPPPDNSVERLCSRVEYYQPPDTSLQRHAWGSGLRSLLSPLPYTNWKFGTVDIGRAVESIFAKQDFDLILANFAFMADAVPPEVARSTPVVLDEHESEGLLGASICAAAALPCARSDW